MRSCSNWIQAYMKYYENTEPATQFHKWTAISVIAGALRKKVHLKLGDRIKIFPNLYIVLVAEPGIARKSQSITFGMRFLQNIPDVVMSAEATTKEALLQDLEASAQDEAMPDGTLYRHCSLNITSKEFESFLGQKKENTKMLVLLTDLYDCEEMPWKYRTKSSGSNVIPSVFLNMEAATTPDSLASCLPPTAIGGGLTSRIMFIWANNKAKKVPRPRETKEEVAMATALQKDLYIISRMSGVYKFSEEAGRWWDDWYNAYDERDPGRACKDKAFAAWYSRKPNTILKVAMAMSAAEHNSFSMETRFLQQAIQEVELAESSMGHAFRGVGKNKFTSEIGYILSEIELRGRVNTSSLMQTMWRDLLEEDLIKIIDTVVRTGLARRHPTNPKILLRREQCDTE